MSPSVPSWLIQLVSAPLLHLTTAMTCATSSMEPQLTALHLPTVRGNWCPEPTAPAFRNMSRVPADRRQRGVGWNLRFRWKCRVVWLLQILSRSSADTCLLPLLEKTHTQNLSSVLRFHFRLKIKENLDMIRESLGSFSLFSLIQNKLNVQCSVFREVEKTECRSRDGSKTAPKVLMEHFFHC